MSDGPGLDPTLCGVLPVDKPSGMTSHDIVVQVRRASGVRRVGHAGTLDPLATGLLVVLIGPATRLARFLLEASKTYAARIVFGTQTATDDAEGEVVATSAVDPDLLTESIARRTVAGLVGTHSQVPPAFSAIKIAGKKAYELARAGEQPQLAPRDYTVYEATLVSVSSGPPPSWEVTVTVSSGTYVRALARDLAMTLGTVGHLGALERISSGALGLDDASTLDEIVTAAGEGKLADLLVPSHAALGLPVSRIDADRVTRVSNGRPLDPAGIAEADHLPEDGMISLVSSGRLVAVYTRRDQELLPEVVLPGGCS